jgi:hypothetical protein
MQHCNLCQKPIWPWQEHIYIGSLRHIYHWDCGYTVDDKEKPLNPIFCRLYINRLNRKQVFTNWNKFSQTNNTESTKKEEP